MASSGSAQLRPLFENGAPVECRYERVLRHAAESFADLKAQAEKLAAAADATGHSASYAVELRLEVAQVFAYQERSMGYRPVRSGFPHR
jgi:hypothetical protein